MTTQSQPLTNVKLSAAQVSLIQRIGLKTISLIGQTGDDYDMLITLITLKMIRRAPRFPKGREMYELSIKGLKFLETLTEQSAMEPAAPATNIPLLPAWTLSRPAPVDTPALKMGDTVTGETARGNLVTGKVIAIGRKVVTGVNYVHVLSGSITHEIAIENVLPGKMEAAPAPRIMDEDTAPVIETKHDLYKAMKVAEEVYIRYMRLDTWDLPADHATYQKKVKAHIDYLRASAAFTGLSNEYLIAYLYGAQKAKIQGKEGGSSPSTPVQDRSIAIEPMPAEMAVQRDLEASTVISPLTGRPLTIAPKTTFMKLAPKQPMNASQRTSEDGLQKMIRAAGGAS